MNNFLLYPAWIIPAISQLLALLHYWQRKEYRWDRMFDFFRYDEGRLIVQHPANSILLLASIVDLATVQTTTLVPIISGFIATTATIYRILEKGLLRPVWTKKMLLLLICHLLTIILIGSQKPLVTTAGIVIWQIISITTWANLLKLPTRFAKDYKVKNAQKKLSTLTSLISIGITGSYGKSSTKEFLAHVLSATGQTAKTPANINTEIGVARYAMQKISSADKFFVCEMGAYSKGEIKKTAQMVNPQIGIITTIGNQHLSLFGSREAIAKAKGELIENLAPNGTAILNYANEHCRQIGNKYSGTVLSYSIDPKHPADLELINKVQTEHGWQITLKAKTELLTKTEYQLVISNIPAALIENILPVILAARQAGMDETSIFTQLKSLTSKNYTKLTSNNGAKLIFDTYNANPTSISKGLEELAKYDTKQKLLITIGLLELGPETKDAYKNLANKLLELGITAIFLKRIPYEICSEFVGHNSKLLHYHQPQEVSKILEKLEPSETAIFVANRIPKFLEQQLKSL